MLNSASVDSITFRRLTNRQKPKLPHPTATQFDLDEWRSLLDDDNVLVARDATLIQTAALIGTNINLLRERYIEGVFAGLSAQHIATFAVADANRSWAILREKSNEMLKAEAAALPTAYVSATSQQQLDVGPLTPRASADDLNTTIVDALPHWFAQAVDTPAESSRVDFEYNIAGAKAQAMLSLEHAFREVWQQILWEPWQIERTKGGWVVAPPDQDDHGLWRAWIWREQAVLLQWSFMRSHQERALPAESRSRVLTQTVVSTKKGEQGYDLEVGSPDERQATGHRMAMEVLESAYVAPFLDQPISGGEVNVTPRLLQLATCVLQDLGELLMPEDADVEYSTVEDINRLSCSLPRQELVGLVAETVGMRSDQAEFCIDYLTSYPFKDVGPLFRNGLWHRPLVATRDGQELQIVLGALVWGSPLRRVERWLQEGVRTVDLSRTPLGLRYEAHVRAVLQAALGENNVLSPVSSDVASIPKGQAAEEIDGLIRIGSTVLVLEIKCLLAPSDPIDRHDYLVKLEDACRQAERKANWLRNNVGEVGSRVGLPDDGRARLVPLVVVNQSSGTSCRFGECVVVDAHFLRLYLSSAEYLSGGALDFTKPGRAGFARRTLYQNAAEAEAGIPGTFEAHPGLEVFRGTVRWERSSIPLANGETLFMSYPVMDAAAYKDAMPDPDSLLAGV